MTNKCFFLLIFLLFCSTGNANPAHSLTAINQEIDTVSQQLEDLRKEEFNAEMEGQDYLRNDEKIFSEKIELAEEKEREADRLTDRLKQLQEQKQILLKQQ